MRLPAKLVLAGAALSGLVSCSQDAVAPSRKAAPVISSNPALAALVIPKSLDFVIPADGGTVTLLGVYRLSFPANAVCDPHAQDTQDGYAAAAWDAPCTVLTSDITIHATLKWSHQSLSIDFSPALRFNPATEVRLSTDILSPLVQYYAGSADDASGLSFMGIAYAPSLEAPPVNDALLDPSVGTRIDLTTGRLSRRVKHFSGYNVVSGETCEISPTDPNCIEFVPDGGH